MIICVTETMKTTFFPFVFIAGPVMSCYLSRVYHGSCLVTKGIHVYCMYIIFRGLVLGAF